MKLIARPLLAAAALVAASTVARAQAPAPAAASPKLAVAAENRTAAAEAARGKRRADAGVRAGDVLHYRLTFANTAGRPIRSVVLSNPLPAGLRYVAHSRRASRADPRAEYSADGGRTFSARPTETVVVGGRREQRAVAPERYTDVRWTVAGWVPADSAVTAESDARLGAAPAAAPGAPAAPAAPNASAAAPRGR
jgi:uncharacterized repeat protein (TIGR01451 family)